MESSIALPTNNRQVAIFSGILVIATLLVYSSSLPAPLTFDDNFCLLENPSLDEFFPSTDRIPGGLVGRPVGRLSFTISYLLSGMSPVGFRIGNILIHVASGLVLFGLVRRTLMLPQVDERFRHAAAGLAFAVALLWMLHPLTTQSVTYVIQRLESLASLFYLLTLYALVRGNGSKRPWAWYGVSIASCWLGVATKEVVATAPVVALLYDRTFLSTSWKIVFQKRWFLYLMLVLSIGFPIAVLMIWIEERPSLGLGDRTNLTSWEYLRSQPGVILHYLRLVFWPDRLIIDHFWPIAKSPWEIFGLGAVILGMLGFGTFAFWRWPAIGFLIWSFFIILAPTSSVIPIADIAFEHRMYLPLACVVTFVVVLVYSAFQRLESTGVRWRPVAVVLLVVVALSLALRTTVRNGDYRQPIRLWEQAVKTAPHNPRAHMWLGVSLDRSKELPKAEREYREAIRLLPRFAWAHSNLAVILAARGERDSAIKHYREAIKITPKYGIPLYNLGNLYAREGNFAEAIVNYLTAIESPDCPPGAQERLGFSYLELKNYQGASTAFQHAIRVQPQSVLARVKLAWIRAAAPSPELRSGEDAVALISPIIEHPQGRNAENLDVAAAAYAEAGNFTKAIELARIARHLAQAAGNEQLAKAIDERLELYGKQAPYRLPVASRETPSL